MASKNYFWSAFMMATIHDGNHDYSCTLKHSVRQLKCERCVKSKLVSVNLDCNSPVQEVNYMCPLNSEGFPDR